MERARAAIARHTRVKMTKFAKTNVIAPAWVVVSKPVSPAARMAINPTMMTRGRTAFSESR